MSHVSKTVYTTTILLTLLYSRLPAATFGFPPLFGFHSGSNSAGTAWLSASTGSGGVSTKQVQDRVWQSWNQPKHKDEQRSANRSLLETSCGLHTSSFETAEGLVLVNLPDDVTAGDFISGTIVVRPTGEKQPEVDFNLKQLNRYSIEVESQRVPVPARVGHWNVPMKTSAIAVVLRDPENRELGKTKIPVLPYSKSLASEKPTLAGVRSTADRFQLPAMAQAGRPLEIQGPFDGDFENTIVRLDGQIVRILGESPRKVVVQNPRNHLGKTDIEVLKGNVVWRCRYRNIGLSLSAPKLALDHGEETTLTVTVEGLQGLERAVPVELENRSPIVVGLNGGNKQTISLLPEEVVDGTISATRTLTGIGPGDFNIVVGVADPAVPSDCESWQLQHSGS